jgi:hypothetical protein
MSRLAMHIAPVGMQFGITSRLCVARKVRSLGPCALSEAPGARPTRSRDRRRALVKGDGCCGSSVRRPADILACGGCIVWRNTAMRPGVARDGHIASRASRPAGYFPRPTTSHATYAPNPMESLLRFPIERSTAELVRRARAFVPNIIATARQALCPLTRRRWSKKCHRGVRRRFKSRVARSSHRPTVPASSSRRKIGIHTPDPVNRNGDHVQAASGSLQSRNACSAARRVGLSP